MAEFIVNPRRAPRAPARCRVTVVSAAGPFEAETEDVGPRGCQLVSPHPMTKGETVALTISDPKVPEPLRASGRIAWVGPEAPWRAGIAFLEAAIPQTAAWFEQLLEAHPGVRPRQQVPERIPLAAIVYLGPPPRLVVDFSPEEAAVLRTIGSGARVDEVLARLHTRGPSVERTLFSLFARSALTLVRGQAAHPDSWKRILDDVEASLALESLGWASAALAAPPEAPTRTPGIATATPAPVREGGTPVPGGLEPPVSPFGTVALDPSPQFEAGEPAADAPAAPDPHAPARTPAPGGWGGAAPAPDHDGKGVGWRRPAKARSPVAQAAFDRAHAEFLAGNVNTAIALLRRALALAPGDSEIAAVLGKLAFRDRDPGAR